ncbi:AAA family ATPase [Chloroflexota bacterium]
MLDSPQHDFLTTELDPDLLLTPFRVQTNWHVITGAACSGKTTLIDLLTNKGFQTEPESARQYIEIEMARGQTLDEIFEDVATEPGIEDMQLRIEHELRANDVVFLVRALPDSLTFRRLAGLNPDEILVKCFHHRYASVFVLERLPFLQNGARIEDDVIAGFIDEWLTRDYSALGYSVLRVPVLSPQELLVFVLERLSEQGHI